MAVSEEAGQVLDPPSNLRATKRAGSSPALLVAAVGAVVILLWAFPLFRIVPLKPPAGAAPAPDTAVVFDPVSAAARIWRTDLPAAANRAVELKSLAPAVRTNADAAKTKFAKSAGLGTAYYFVRGSGKIVSRERNTLRIVIDGAAPEIVELRIGLIFGNTVRDGCGFLDVNAFPGLQEFNALSTELNALVEKTILPALREKAVVGATVHFAGCAEAPESAADAGDPLLLVVPVQAEVR